jgi:hypothetical protein
MPRQPRSGRPTGPAGPADVSPYAISDWSFA